MCKGGDTHAHARNPRRCYVSFVVELNEHGRQMRPGWAVMCSQVSRPQSGALWNGMPMKDMKGV